MSRASGQNTNTSSIDVISLCSGVGVFDLAFTFAGFRIVAQVENNPFCRRVLQARHNQFFPHSQIFEDVKNVGRNNLPRADVIVAGFPCQPVSGAGKQRGIDDERWLWEDIARIIEEIKPRIVFLENVRGLYTANDGNAFRSVLQSLSDGGYDAEWACLRADATVGAPHARPRWFCIASLANAESGGNKRESGTLAYSSNETRQQNDGAKFDGSGKNNNAGDRRIKSRMGRTVFDGPAFGLDKSGHYRYWAASPTEAQHSYEPPRLASNIAHRNARVKAVGNSGVMPLIYKLALIVREKLTTTAPARTFLEAS